MYVAAWLARGAAYSWDSAPDFVEPAAFVSIGVLLVAWTVLDVKARRIAKAGWTF